MRMNNYNDGIASIYTEFAGKTDFNAKKNAKTLADLEFIVKLPYDEKTVRQQDVEYFDQIGTKKTMKIVTPLVGSVQNKHKAVINGYLYSITHIDPSRKKNELYIYLEGVRELAE